MPVENLEDPKDLVLRHRFQHRSSVMPQDFGLDSNLAKFALMSFGQVKEALPTYGGLPMKTTDDSSSLTVPLTRENVSFVAHEIRSPLAIVTGYIGLLLEDTQDPLSAGQQQLAERIQRAACELERLIAETVDLTRLVARINPGETPENLDLNPILQESLGVARLLLVGRKAELKSWQPSTDLWVRAEPGATRSAFLATATYLARAMRAGTLELHTGVVDGFVEVRWSSNSIHVSEDLAKTLREPLTMIRGLEGGAAWRLGLAAAREHLIRSGGQLEVQTTGDGAAGANGTTLMLRLPSTT